jgi:hypothetical protein
MAPLLSRFSDNFGLVLGKISGPSFSATGGTTYTYNGKKIHVFTSTGDFTVSGGSLAVEVFVVAGGGGGT